MVLFLVNSVVFSQSYSMDNQNSILVYGEGKVSVPVEYIAIRFAVTSLEKSGSNAQKRNNKVINTIASLLKANFNIKKTQLITENSTLYPEYIYEKDERKFSGFRARDSVVLKLEDIDDYSEVLAALTRSSIEEINSIEYLPSTDKKYYNTALKLALQQAQEKAEVLAIASDRSIQAISYIEELYYENQAPYERKGMMFSDSFESPARMTNSTIQDSANIKVSVQVLFTLK